MNRKGQILVGVIVMTMILLIIIPAMVLYTQNEARWSLKQRENMTAFQLAEAAVERGFNVISQSTTVWANGQNGVFPDGCKLDIQFNDLPGGSYVVGLSSGPESQQVTILGIGREIKGKEVRAIQAVYANAPLGNVALRAASSLTMGGSQTTVHWGAVMSNQSITIQTSKNAPGTWPQYYSAGAISPFITTNSGTNCDTPYCRQLFAYHTTLPPTPTIDTGSFAVTASTETGCPAGGSNCSPGGNTTCCFYNGNQTWAGGGGSDICDDATMCADGRVYYVNGNLTVNSNGIYVMGSLIVTGNLTLPNGQSGQGAPTVVLPSQAWKQYGNAWDTYKDSEWLSPKNTDWDTTPSRPVEFPTLNSTYTPNVQSGTVSNNVMVNGFLYVGGNLTSSGGAGQTVITGAIYVAGTVTLTPNTFTVYYTDYGANQVKTTTVILSRVSWQDVLRGYPF